MLGIRANRQSACLGAKGRQRSPHPAAGRVAIATSESPTGRCRLRSARLSQNQSTPFYKADTLCDARGLERLFPPSDINFPTFLPRPDFHCESSDDGNLLLAELGFTSFGVSSTVQPSPQPSRPLNQQVPPPQPAASPPAGGPTQQPPRSPSQTTASNSPPQQPQNARPSTLASSGESISEISERKFGAGLDCILRRGGSAPTPRDFSGAMARMYRRWAREGD